jgi:hypothetical protein
MTPVMLRLYTLAIVVTAVTRCWPADEPPTRAVSRFLDRPEVQFSPPRLGPDALHKEVQFEARVTPLLPSRAPLTVDLILKAGDGPERTARMKANGDRYCLTAVPIPGRSGPSTLRLVARFEDGSLEATTTDRTFKVGSRMVALADVRTIWPGSPARVSLRDGTTINGALSGLDAAPVPVGPKTLSVSLDHAKSVEIKPEGQTERVTCTLVVRQGEKEVYRHTQGLGDVELLTNPSFEVGLKAWTPFSTLGAQTRFDLDTNEVREGQQSLQISAPQISDSGCFQDIMLKPGHQYRFSGWVRTRGLDPHVAGKYGTFDIQHLGANWGSITTGTNHGGDTEWTEVTLTFRAPSDGLTRIVAVFAIFGGTGTAWYDDLKLVELDGPPASAGSLPAKRTRQASSPGASAPATPAGSHSANGTRLAASSDERVGHGPDPAGAQPKGLGDAELLTNQSFEAGFKSWTQFTVQGREPRFDLDPDVVREGRQSLRISATQLAASGCYQDVMLKPGHRYGFSGWVRTRGLDPNGTHVYGTFLIQRPPGIHGNIVAGTYHGGDTDWTEVRLTFEAPSDGWTRIVVAYNSFGMGTGTAWYDDLKLVELDQSATWPASLPGVAWLVAAILAVLSLIILLVAHWRQWWPQLGSRWPLRSPTLAVKAATTKAWATLSCTYLHLEKPRALANLLGASRRTGTARGHPDPAILELFAAGRLRSSEMERIGEHLAECSDCLEVLEQLPEDSMVGMLRDHGDRVDQSSGEPVRRENRDEKPGRFDGAVREVGRVARDPDAMRLLETVEDDGVQLTAGSIDNPRYELKTLLGGGGMGLIYLAHDRQENRDVVLKFLREDLLDQPRLVERFRREAAAATLLKHPNIVEAYGVELFGRCPALVMEHVRGKDLARLIDKAGRVPVRVGCELIRRAALGLQYSFEQGMVHRDIKPSNLIAGVDGTVKILDFGLAKMQSELSVDAGLTSTGAFLGSVDYIAPEQLDDPRLADIRADIYSLGCTLYHLLSGTPPFHGTTLQVLEAHRSLEARPLNEVRPELSSELALLVGRMMAKQPGRRFQTPTEVARRLMPFAGPAVERTAAWKGEATIEAEA